MTTTYEGLTPTEQQYLEHARAAESQGVPLSKYCRAAGLSAYALYSIRRRLVQKGVLSRQRAVRKPAVEKPFIAVRVEKPGAGANGGVCRLQSPNGWVIECASWPEPDWVRDLTEKQT
jgi:hypothetical protein